MQMMYNTDDIQELLHSRRRGPFKILNKTVSLVQNGYSTSSARIQNKVETLSQIIKDRSSF